MVELVALGPLVRLMGLLLRAQFSVLLLGRLWSRCGLGDFPWVVSLVGCCVCTVVGYFLSVSLVAYARDVGGV